MNRLFRVILAVGLTLGGGFIMAAQSETGPGEMNAFFPTEVKGWRAEGPGEVYDATTLYEYIDGGAEVYRSFHVQRVVARRYEKSGADPILVDLFDMGSAGDAFGAYHHDIREASDAGIGQESEYQQGVLQFWKGRYFVSLLAFDETGDSRAAVLKLGRGIAEAIREEGSRPDLIHLLPADGLLPAHLHYFHDSLCLKTHYSLPWENPFSLTSRTEGMLARYRSETRNEGDSIIAMAIRYPSREAAEQAENHFLAASGLERSKVGCWQFSQGSWAGIRIVGDLLLGVFEAPAGEEVARMLDRMEQAAK